MDVLRFVARLVGWRTENSPGEESVLLFARFRNYFLPGIMLAYAHSYFDYCSDDNRIPLYLMIGGALGAIQGVIGLWLDAPSYHHIHGLLDFARNVFSTIFLMWFMAGFYVIWYMRMPIAIKECYADLRAFTVGMLFIQSLYGCLYSFYRLLESFS